MSLGVTRSARMRRMDSSFVAVPRVADYTSKRVRWATWALIGIVILLFIGSIAVLARGSSSSTPQPRYERFAEIVAGDWVAGRPLSVPTVAGINTSGDGTPFSSIAAPKSDGLAAPPAQPGPPALTVLSSGYWHFEVTSQAKQPYSETDHFLLQTTSGLFDLAISVVDANGVPLLAGLPTVSVTGFGGQPNVGQVLPTGWVKTGLSTGETNQIDQWAKAYVTNDEETLYEITGDARATHYVGLGGQWTLDGTPAISGSWSNKKTDTTVARVQLTVTLKDQTFGTSYDVLIGDVGHRNLPPIEAWGPTSSGFTLKPFQNAVAGATGGGS